MAGHTLRRQYRLNVFNEVNGRRLAEDERRGEKKWNQTKMAHRTASDLLNTLILPAYESATPELIVALSGILDSGPARHVDYVDQFPVFIGRSRSELHAIANGRR